MKAALIVLVVAVAALLSVPTASLVYEAGGPENCARCHEMGSSVGTWMASTHRKVPCAKCHGDALTVDARFHMNNASRVVDHLRGSVAERPRLRPDDVLRHARNDARSCHQQQFAAWSQRTALGQPTNQIFLDQKHNSARAR